MFVTENGTYREDEGLDADGTCKDEHRIRYIEGYVRWMKRAIDEGIDLRGYYAWSLMDNWEWTAGYHYRFGLVHVDYETAETNVEGERLLVPRSHQTQRIKRVKNYFRLFFAIRDKFRRSVVLKVKVGRREG